MGRKKIDIKKICDEKTLLVTFAKRKVGLFNKAFELSQLCDCQVAILIFTNKNRLHKYTSDDIDEIIKRYQKDRDCGELITNDHIIKRREKKKILKVDDDIVQYGGVDMKLLHPHTNQTTTCSDGCDDDDMDDDVDDRGSNSNMGVVNQTSMTDFIDDGPHLKPVDNCSIHENTAIDSSGVSGGAFLLPANCAPSFCPPAGEKVAEDDVDASMRKAIKRSPAGFSDDHPHQHIAADGKNLSKQTGVLRAVKRPIPPTGPPNFGDSVNSFDPSLGCCSDGSKRREIRNSARTLTSSDSDLCTPEPNALTTPVFSRSDTTFNKHWTRVDPPISAISAEPFTRRNASNEVELVTPDSSKITVAPDFMGAEGRRAIMSVANNTAPLPPVSSSSSSSSSPSTSSPSLSSSLLLSSIAKGDVGDPSLQHPNVSNLSA